MAPRLKSLDLQGYKTFAGKTTFEFPADITAIVGPNGAGKSNVADSLRWVLGEQSFSLLRGRKTEDMIFAGSEQRPRASMAAATITFNNEDNWLPIDFAEVSITRRAYRDGQNEYLLNNQRIRLKEIAELLSKSGLAERTYTIIGQGLVDSALSLRPEERRRFFEEAAGIGLFRSRREDAINRLEATQRNLERVNDIILELQPRLATLEKQAQRAREYERLRNDLRVLLREWYGYHWHKGTQDLVHTREADRLQEDRLQKVRQLQEETQSKLDAQRILINTDRSELNRAHAELATIHREWELVSKNLAVKDERQRSYLEQKDRLQLDLTRLESEAEASNERMQSFLADHKYLQEEIAETKEQLEQARKLLSERKQERQRVEQALNEIQKKLIDLDNKKTYTKSHQNDLNTRLSTLVSFVENSNSSVIAGHEELENHKKVEGYLSSELEKIKKETQQAEARLAEHKKKIQELDTRNKEVQEKISSLDASGTKLAMQLDILKQAENSLSGINQGARFIVEAVRNGRLRGEFLPFGSILNVQPEYEVCIAAVLGDYLEGILLGKEAEQEHALLLLENGENGRVVLLPGKLNGERVGITRVEDKDVIGFAAEFVKASPDFEQIINQLLGQVLIVRNRKSAQRLIKQLPTNACVVTLSGEVYWGNGVVVAGKDSRAEVIARPRQIRELQAKYDEIKKQQDALSWNLLAQEKDLGSLKSEEFVLQENVNNSISVEKQKDKALQEAIFASVHAQQEYEWRKQKYEEVSGQLRDTKKELENIDLEISEINENISFQSQKQQEQSNILRNLPLDEYQAQLTHWETTLAVLTRTFQDAETRHKEYERLAENYRTQLNVNKQRLIDAETELVKLEEEKTELHKQEDKLTQVIQALQEKTNQGEAKLVKLEDEFANSQKAALTTQQSLANAERLSSQAHLEYNRHKEKLETLRRRIEDDFGLVAFDYDMDIQGQTPLPLDIVEQLPVIKELPEDFETQLNQQKAQIRRMGAINPEAQNEYDTVKERYDFLNNQMEDLKKADTDLRQVIRELDELMKKEFRETFDAVAVEFQHMFTRLFDGGSANLIMTDEENPTETGIDINARLPGRREQGLSLLSGGERSLTAVALIFALLKVAPTPFCVLDEVDAMLDEANVGRFCDLLNVLSQKTQFVVITHNRNTVQTAGVIFGVTMARDSTSQVISLKLDEISEDMVR